LTGEHAKVGWRAAEAPPPVIVDPWEALALQHDHSCSSSSSSGTPRFYLCARCHRQVVICRQCDRGNIYCGPGCAQEARRSAQKEARARYQASARGRELHAQRSRRYRARHRRVTDQGSIRLRLRSTGVPHPQSSRRIPWRAFATPLVHRCSCHCCGKPVSVFFRQSGIRRPIRR